ncbi:MAG TPA: GNAT family N-acetyltransferase, partial [Chloroflexia bacterium]|nr:GNAT family N-acetyltransferase [Chloroflexia bacterium]
RMVHPLNEEIPEPKFPEGYTLRHKEGAEEAEKWVECFNQSFIDHWNFFPETVEDHVHWLKSPHYRKELDLVAIAPDGSFAAFCFCGIDPEDNKRNNRKDGWIHILGTRRGHRKIGLGTAMLLSGLRKLKEEGMETGKLGVDAENPTGALQLYEANGFTKATTGVSYFKKL